MAKRRIVPANRIERQVKSLRMRVAFLERALKPAKKAAPSPSTLDDKRRNAEKDAQDEALRDYYKQQNVAIYRRSPWLLESDLKIEREKNEFLRSRGLKPLPSRIPPEFRKKPHRKLS